MYEQRARPNNIRLRHSVSLRRLHKRLRTITTRFHTTSCHFQVPRLHGRQTITRLHIPTNRKHSNTTSHISSPALLRPPSHRLLSNNIRAQLHTNVIKTGLHVNTNQTHTQDYQREHSITNTTGRHILRLPTISPQIYRKRNKRNRRHNTDRQPRLKQLTSQYRQLTLSLPSRSRR